MAYATDVQLRAISNFSVAEVTAADVATLIPLADRSVMRMATQEAYHERLDGDRDGSNVLFITQHKPIADVSLDKMIDKDDVTVWLVDYDAEMNPTSTETAVTSVNSRDGVITLASAPTVSNAQVGVYCDYRYYKRVMDFNTLGLASSYYLAHLCELKMIGQLEAEYLRLSAHPKKTDVLKTTKWLTMVEDLLNLVDGLPSLMVVK